MIPIIIMILLTGFLLSGQITLGLNIFCDVDVLISGFLLSGRLLLWKIIGVRTESFTGHRSRMRSVSAKYNGGKMTIFFVWVGIIRLRVLMIALPHPHESGGLTPIVRHTSIIEPYK